MKSFFLLVGVITVIGVILLFTVLREETKYQERVRKITHVSICLKEQMDNIKGVRLIMCDSIVYYPIEVIQDTVSENVAISDHKFPCAVSFGYDYLEGSQKTIQVDSFDCAGCSGYSFYELYADSIISTYKN